MNATPDQADFTVSLDLLKVGTRARVVAIDWESLDQAEANRLRHFGFDEDVVVELLYFGPFGRDPIAIRVGRMTVAVRRAHARAVRVIPTDR
ncbi:MAG TPA: FeoA family protein [Sphingomicrobium sp.]|jgi:ferrous iron transport protein A|nr:FeoA family protein [Sphingomicrobium sp.]